MDPILSIEFSLLALAIALGIVKAVLFQKHFPGSPLANWFHLDTNNVYSTSENSKVVHARKIQNTLTFVIFSVLFVLWMFWLLNKG